MPQLVVVGSINADLTIHVPRHPHPGETIMGCGGEISAGGKGANQAVAAARLGAQVALIGAVGEDAYRTAALEHAIAAGVDLSGVVTLAGTPTGLAVITVDQDGENTIVLSPGANGGVDDSFVQQRTAMITQADILLLQGEIPAAGFAAAVRAATGRIIINLAPVVEVDEAALRRADPLLANEHEAGLILDQLGIPRAGEAPHDLARALLGAGFASVVLTLGKAGAVVATAEGLIDVPTPQVVAVDTTGAGDAFAGALCARLLAGEDLVSAAHFAARVGAAATLGAGAQPSYPDFTTPLPCL